MSQSTPPDGPPGENPPPYGQPPPGQGYGGYSGGGYSGGDYGSGGYGGYGGGQPPYQQYGAGYQPAGPPPANNLVFAILATFFCCLPLGVVAIVFAAQVNGKWQAGDAAGARESARKARLWSIWSAAVGAIWVVLVLVLVVAGGLLAGTSSTTIY